MDSNKKYRSVLPRGFLQVSVSDHLCDSIHRPSPPARRLLYSWLLNTYERYKKNCLYPLPEGSGFTHNLYKTLKDMQHMKIKENLGEF